MARDTVRAAAHELNLELSGAGLNVGDLDPSVLAATAVGALLTGETFTLRQGQSDPALRQSLRKLETTGGPSLPAVSRKAGLLMGRIMAPNSSLYNPPFEWTIPHDKSAPLTMQINRASPEIPMRPAGIVVDYGMGVGGLVAHRPAVRRGRYRLWGLQKTEAEVGVLSGMSEAFGLEESDMPGVTIWGNGMAADSERLLEEGFEGDVDLVVASQISGAGREARLAINNAHSLLRPGGHLVLYGPKQAVMGGRGTDRQAKDALASGFAAGDILHDTEQLDNIPGVDKRQLQQMGDLVTNRLVVLRKS